MQFVTEEMKNNFEKPQQSLKKILLKLPNNHEEMAAGVCVNLLCYLPAQLASKIQPAKASREGGGG